MSQNEDISGYEDILDNEGYEDILSQPDKPNFGNILQKAAKAIVPSMGAMTPLSGPLGPGMDFANQFKREMFDINPQEKFEQGDMAGFAGDFSKDYFTNPDTYTMSIGGAGVQSGIASRGLKGFKIPSNPGFLDPIGIGANQVQNPLLQAAKSGGRNILRTAVDIFHSGKNLKNVKGQLGGVESEMAAMKAPADTSYGPLTEAQGTQLGQRVLRKVKSTDTENIESQGRRGVKEMTQKYKAQRTDLGNKMNSVLEEEVKSYKDAMESVNKENTPIYGQRLDDLQANLKTPITPEEYHKAVIEPSLKEIAEKRLPLGGPEATIKSWAEKFAPKMAAGAEEYPEGILASPYMMEPSAPTAKPAPLTLRGLNNIKNDIYNSQDYSTRTGVQKPTPQDLGANIFYKNHRKFLDSRVPGHAELQGDYGPLAESTSNIYRAIRPGEEDLQPGMNILQKAAKGKAFPNKSNPDIERNLSRVETGHGGFKGTGNLREGSTNIAKNMKELDLKFTGNKEALLQQVDRKIQEIEGSFGEDMSTIKRGAMERKANILEKQSRLEQSHRGLSQEKERLEKLYNVKKWLIRGAATSAGLGTAYEVGRRVS